MFRREIYRCDLMMCHTSGNSHTITDRSDWATGVNLVPSECPVCGADAKDVKFSCMRTLAIISGEPLLFCVVHSQCTKCSHVDWFRPDPEIVCQYCRYPARFNLPTSSWALPWECNRWS